MGNTNRTCYTCGTKYYFCPSCPGDKRNPQIYTMWDSEKCKTIFNTLVKESTGDISTKECKDILVNLGIDTFISNKESIVKHIGRVMSYVDQVDIIEKDSLQDDIEVNYIKMRSKFARKYNMNSEVN